MVVPDKPIFFTSFKIYDSSKGGRFTTRFLNQSRGLKKGEKKNFRNTKKCTVRGVHDHARECRLSEIKIFVYFTEGFI